MFLKILEQLLESKVELIIKNFDTKVTDKFFNDKNSEIPLLPLFRYLGWR